MIVCIANNIILIRDILKVPHEIPTYTEHEREEAIRRNDTLVIIIDSLRHEQQIKIEDAKNASDSDAFNLWQQLLKR